MNDQTVTMDEETMVNSYGNKVPARLVAGRVKLEDQTVRMAVQKAEAMQAEMKK